MGAEVAGLALMELDFRNQTIQLTPTAARMFELGEAAVTVPLEWVRAKFHSDDLTEMDMRIAASLDPSGDGRLAAEHRLRLAGGTVRWLRVRQQVTFEGSGAARRPVTGVLAAIDITNEKELELELRRNEHRFRQLADSMPQLVWSTRPDGFCDFHNQGWVEYTGLSLGESRGTGWTVVVHPDDLPILNEQWMLSLKTGEAYEVESRYRRSDGQYRWFLIRAVPVKDTDGEIVRWSGTERSFATFEMKT